MNDDLEELARRLHAHPDYRVLRKLRNVDVYETCGDAACIRRALLVDVETTGLSHLADVIIELGVILFTYNVTTGRILEVLATESWFNDPGRPIPPGIVKLTGITDLDVRDQCIDETRLQELADDVALVIAHNAAFDRPFIDRRFPFLADRHWGCSMNDVPWHTLRMASPKLEYLLPMHTGSFLATHHRALDDCRATLHVLATAFPDARTPMQLLLASCRSKRSRVAAVQSPFDTKDMLKQRGYSWSGDTGRPPKTWCKEVVSAEVAAEVHWLREHVYAGASAAPLVEPVDLRRRYCA